MALVGLKTITGVKAYVNGLQGLWQFKINSAEGLIIFMDFVYELSKIEFTATRIWGNQRGLSR